MSANIPGYEYDIFISYRQNDNLPAQAGHDGWVTRFVEALNKELKATLKNEVSIYFDENPHDGLLETHQVDASLAKKLKCLVFIPIISQTYCDEKCFAWEHEFIPFIDMAKQDELGMNVMVINGNVVSRVLPIQIHELDPEDQSIIAKELGGPLRAINFIYSEPGVNRPLKPEDKKEDNLNRTNYHNQINKVANALKEIGTSLIKREIKKENEPVADDKTVVENASLTVGKRIPPLSIFIASIILVVILFSGYFLLPQLNKEASTIDGLEKSIAVLAFENMSNDPEQEYFSDGVSEEIINALVKIPGLKVAGRTSSFSFKDKEDDLRTIANKLDVAMILAGSVRKDGDKIRVTAQLIDAETGFHHWSETFESNVSDIFKTQDEIAKNIIDKMKLTLNPNQLITSKYQPKAEAYDLYLKGMFFWNKRGFGNLSKALGYFQDAVKVDSLYALAYASIAQTHGLLMSYGFTKSSESLPPALENANKAIELDPASAEGYAAMGYIQMYGYWDLKASDGMFLKSIELNPNYATARYWRTILLIFSSKINEALEESLKGTEIDPFSAIARANYSWALFMNKNYSEGVIQANYASELNLSSWTIHMQVINLAGLEKYDEALRILKRDSKAEDFNSIILKSQIYYLQGDKEKLKETHEEIMVSPYAILTFPLAISSWLMGDRDEAEKYLAAAVANRESYLLAYISGTDLVIDPELTAFLKKEAAVQRGN